MNSVLDIIFKQVKQRASSPALYYLESGAYLPISYQHMALSAQRLSQWVSSVAPPGDRVVIWSNNCWQWAVTDLAIQLSGGVSVPVYPTAGADQLSFIFSDASPTVVFLDTLSDDRLAALQAIQGLKKVVVFGHVDQRPGNDLVLDFSDAMDAVPDIHALDASLWVQDRLHDTLTILYTSGTTGVPKAVPLTHNNIVQNFLGILDTIPISHTDSSLSFLPLSHIFERTVGYYCVLGVGASIYYAQSMDTVATDLLLSKPTVIISVPRLYEKIYAKVMAVTGLKKGVLMLALWIGRLFDSKRALWRLAYRVVFSKIHEKTGGNVRFLVSGGAPISSHIEVFFNAIGLPVVQGYGLTETSPIITANFDQRVGSVGQPLSNLSVRISDDGEICVKGESVFSGYLNVSNDGVFTSDGFFNTGDLGHLDSDGYLVITGRKKELIVLSNGKNVAPNAIEEVLIQSEYIHQVVVLGNNRSYLVALVVVDVDQVRHALDVLDELPELVQHSELLPLVMDDIQRLSARLSGYQTVKKVALIGHEFSIDGMELTPTLKLRRKEINKKYHDLIESLYHD